MVNFPTRIPDCDSDSPAVLDLLIFFNPQHLFYSGFPSIGNSDHIVAFTPLNFFLTQKGMSVFIAQPVTILMLIEIVFVFILEMFHERTPCKLVLLLLLQNFVSRLEFMHISLIVNIRSSSIHLHSFQLLVLLPQLIEIIFLFVLIK